MGGLFSPPAIPSMPAPPPAPTPPATVNQAHAAIQNNNALYNAPPGSQQTMNQGGALGDTNASFTKKQLGD
jgi:hypothetical protein